MNSFFTVTVIAFEVDEEFTGHEQTGSNPDYMTHSFLHSSYQVLQLAESESQQELIVSLSLVRLR